MRGITYDPVDRYMHDLIPPRDATLREMEELASREHIPIVGPAVGHLLELLAGLTGAHRVFEMGSAIGYSTIWWARGIQPDGRVYYTDGSVDNARRAETFFEKAGVADRVEVLTGNSLDLIETVAGEFDIVFNDVDKHYYPEVYRKASGRVRVGGLLVTDNVLWSGRVADPVETDASTESIREFNRLVYEDPRFRTTIVPMRDGVSIARRIR